MNMNLYGPSRGVTFGSVPAPYLRTSLYSKIQEIIASIAASHDARARFVVSEDPENLGIVVCVGLARGNETFELDFGRIVSMLEKQETLDLDWSEVEQYIAATCALLPSRKHDEEVPADYSQQLSQHQLSSLGQGTFMSNIISSSPWDGGVGQQQGLLSGLVKLFK